MPSFRRASLGLTDLRSIAARRLTLALCAAAATTLSLAALSTPAYAHVEEVSTKAGGPTVKVGLQPRESEYFWYGSHKYNGLGKSESAPNHAAASFDNAAGAEVVHTVNTYAIYWDPQDYYHGDWQFARSLSWPAFDRPPCAASRLP